ncbi:MAG: hypothetical protein BGO67_11155 [Alphaproteobacteria bacterium 41-28]|nr:MAG: hypothetical protein BGO67_11155 [Alphaproteobacteria bacterium 41-28]
MKNRILILAIALGGVFLSGSALNANKIKLTCKVFTQVDFPRNEDCPTSGNCWSKFPENRLLVIYFNQVMSGVSWKGGDRSPRSDVNQLTQIAHPVASLERGRPACKYSFLFDNDKNKTEVVRAFLISNEYNNCTVISQDTFECDKRSEQ